MKHVIVITSVLALILFSCSTEPTSVSYLFIVKVDSIAHPSAVRLNDTIAIQLFGTIGENGCYSFSYFDATLEPRTLDLAVIGEYTGETICPDVMVYLDGKEYRCVATEQGWFKVNIRQPEGEPLRDSLFVY